MSELRHRKTTEEGSARTDAGKESEQSSVDPGKAHSAAGQDMSDFSKEGIRLLLRRFYDKVNKDKLGDVNRLVEQFESRVAEKSKAKGAERDPDAVYSELAALNQGLRQTYQKDLSIVTGRGGRSRDARLVDPSDQQTPAEEGGGRGTTAEDVVLNIVWLLFFGATVGLCFYFVMYGDDGEGAERGHGRARQKQHWGRKVQDMRVGVEVTLEQLLTGTEGSVRVRRQEVCQHCHGTGAHSRHRCPRCQGKGVEVGRTMFGMVQMECQQCSGRGWVASHACPHCQGRGVKQAELSVPYKITPGMRHGDHVRVEGAGNQMQEADDGDVVVEVREAKHSVWRRDGQHLRATLRLSLQEALLGFRRELKGVDGAPVVLERRGQVTQMGEEVRVEGRGMPLPASSAAWSPRRGDAVLTLHVDLPKRLSPHQREALAAALPP